MSLKVGESLPHVHLKVLKDTAIEDVAIDTLCATGVTVIFALPGAFTPACSARHLPGFLDHAAAFKAKGVARLACVAVNDAFVMQAWARINKVDDRVMMLADGNGDFTRAIGLETDARPYGMGIRSQRYAMVVKDGVVTHLFVDEPGAFAMSAAQFVLSKL